jgi:hypothetical protein
LFVAKWQSSIGRCRKSDACPKEDLAKSGYKPDMKYKFLIILLYSWLQTETKYRNLVNFTGFFPHFWQMKASKIN